MRIWANDSDLSQICRAICVDLHECQMPSSHLRTRRPCEDLRTSTTAREVPAESFQLRLSNIFLQHLKMILSSARNDASAHTIAEFNQKSSGTEQSRVLRMGKGLFSLITDHSQVNLEGYSQLQTSISSLIINR